MTIRINTDHVPIEYKVLTYYSLAQPVSTIIYASKLSDFAVLVTKKCFGSGIDNDFYFATNKYNINKTASDFIWNDRLLEDLNLSRTVDMRSILAFNKILEPKTDDARWYDKSVDITSMFKK